MNLLFHSREDIPISEFLVQGGQAACSLVIFSDKPAEDAALQTNQVSHSPHPQSPLPQKTSTTSVTWLAFTDWWSRLQSSVSYLQISLLRYWICSYTLRETLALMKSIAKLLLTSVGPGFYPLCSGIYNRKE